jgi:hypothetical protein
VKIADRRDPGRQPVSVPKCGEEVHLVPDYETMESRVMENQLREEEEQERERELARLAEEAALEKRKKEPDHHGAVISLPPRLIVVLAVVLVTGTTAEPIPSITSTRGAGGV